MATEVYGKQCGAKYNGYNKMMIFPTTICDMRRDRRCLWNMIMSCTNLETRSFKGVIVDIVS